MTLDALTGTPWLLTLDNIARRSGDKTTATLAAMLRDVVDTTTDPKVGDILDMYARQLLGGVAMIDVEELDDEHEQRHDFRRANGAPIVSDPTDENKSVRYARPSGFGKDLDNEDALTNWRIWKAMDGVARSKALAAKIASTKDDDRAAKKSLREEALQWGQANEAADTGTALHAMTARVEDPDDEWTPPEQYALDLDAYTTAIARYGFVSERTEYHIVNDEYRTAGTADRLFRLTRDLTLPNGGTMEAGSLVVADLKTGKKLDFSLPGYAVQMALYATGVFYDIHTERRLPTPEVSSNWGILIHLPVGQARCTVLWIDLAVGNEGAWIAALVRKWRREWSNGTNDAYEIAMPDGGLIEEAFPDTTVVIEAKQVPAMLKFCQARIKQIGEHEAARRTLITYWPKGVPTIKKGLSEPADIIKLLNVLDRVEAQYSLPFIEDPRPVAQRGLHRDKVDRANEFLLTT